MVSNKIIRITGHMMLEETAIRIASNSLPDPGMAIHDIFDRLRVTSLSGVILFCSSRCSLDRVAEEVALQQKRVPIIGCTTAGEILPSGPATGTITAVGFPSSDFTFQAIRIADLDNFNPVDAQSSVTALVADVDAKSAALGSAQHRAALLLVDGLSRREELITNTFQHILEGIPLVGGSSGDDMSFRRTHLLFEGRFQTDSAILACIGSKRSLKVFRSHYHVPDSGPAVITRADAAARRVYELNGERASKTYARLLGVSEASVTEATLAEHPVMVRVGGEYYSRSIQRIADDGSMVFESSIDRGLVLRIGRSDHPVDALRRSLAECGGDAHESFDAVLAFESAFNRIEAENGKWMSELSEIYRQQRFVGFHTYGEQFKELHINRNMVGLAIGKPSC